MGHENDPEVGWVLVQVPDFKTFDPIEAGLLPAGTDPASPEFFAAYQQLIYDYYIREAADTLDIPRQELMKVQMIYGPTLFSLVERVGDDALVAPNGVIAGDSFGNGHFLTSGGAMTGMIGHSARVLEYWRARDAGTTSTDAIRHLADSIKDDTHAWLRVSATEYSQAAPINFGAKRIEQINKASGTDASVRANAIEAARRQRHALIPLDPSNWRRLFVCNGRVLSALPELDEEHPLQRPERESSLLTVMKSLPFAQKRVSDQTSVPQDAAEGELTVLRSLPGAPQESSPHEGELTIIRPRLSIGSVEPEEAKIYAFLEIEQKDRTVQRIELKENQVVIGRRDLSRGITPEIDLTPFDSTSSVSRRHARIYHKNTDFYLEDLGSTNKTRLGNTTLTPLKPQVLHDGDMVSFGSIKATFRLLGASALPVPWSPS